MQPQPQQVIETSGERVVVVADPVGEWPPEARLVLAALDASRDVRGDRRDLPRTPYRARAGLKLYSGRAGGPPCELFTRDVSHRGLGFVTPHRLDPSHGGSLHLPAPTGATRTIGCCVLRCREVASGWYEGAVSFNRDEMDFHPAALARWL